MICFRDREFCNALVHKDDCTRRWTPELQVEADKWWGGPGAPVAFGRGCRDTSSEESR